MPRFSKTHTGYKKKEQINQENLHWQQLMQNGHRRELNLTMKGIQ